MFVLSRNTSMFVTQRVLLQQAGQLASAHLSVMNATSTVAVRHYARRPYYDLHTRAIWHPNKDIIIMSTRITKMSRYVRIYTTVLELKTTKIKLNCLSNSMTSQTTRMCNVFSSKLLTPHDLGQNLPAT